MKIGSAIAIIIALYAGYQLAFSYAAGNLLGVAFGVALYIFAAWIHYLSIKEELQDELTRRDK